jgi:hypothetical protein
MGHKRVTLASPVSCHCEGRQSAASEAMLLAAMPRINAAVDGHGASEAAQKKKFAFLQGTGYRACGIETATWCPAWRFALLLQ